MKITNVRAHHRLRSRTNYWVYEVLLLVDAECHLAEKNGLAHALIIMIRNKRRIGQA